MDNETLLKIATWAVSDDTGASSKFLAQCALGSIDPDEWLFSYPSDNGDFGRCFRFAELIPVSLLEQALQIAAARSEKWVIVREHWNDLATMHLKEDPKMYKYMNEIGL